MPQKIASAQPNGLTSPEQKGVKQAIDAAQERRARGDTLNTDMTHPITLSFGEPQKTGYDEGATIGHRVSYGVIVGILTAMFSANVIKPHMDKIAKGTPRFLARMGIVAGVAFLVYHLQKAMGLNVRNYEDRPDTKSTSWDIK